MLAFLLLPIALAFGAVTHDKADASTPPAASTSIVATDTSRVIVDFVNDSWDLATIYVLRESGQYARLGEVAGVSNARLAIPRSVISGNELIRLVAVPIAGRARPNSGQISVSPGDHLSATLSSSLNNLSVLPGRD